MPGMSGFEFLSVVRRRFPEIRVIAMSGAFSGSGIRLGLPPTPSMKRQLALILCCRLWKIWPIWTGYIQPSSRCAPIWILRATGMTLPESRTL